MKEAEYLGFLASISGAPKKTMAPRTPMDELVQALKVEVIKLEKVKRLKEEELKKADLSSGYESLGRHVGHTDIIAIYRWLIKNYQLWQKVSFTQPIRFAAYNALKPTDYPYPVTVHINIDHQGIIYVNFDYNSKRASAKNDGTIFKDPPPEQGCLPKKIIGAGTNKVVRKSLSFNSRTCQIEESVALVSKGHFNIKFLKNDLTMDQLDNPLLWHVRGFIEYSGHDAKQDGEQPKAVAFAPRADGDFFKFLNNIKQYPLKLGDIIWMFYSAVNGLAKYNAAGRLHRDIKPENYLSLRNSYGYCIYLGDFGFSAMAENPEGDVGSPMYVAFDAPVFANAIKKHQKILAEISRFERHYPQSYDHERYPCYVDLRENLSKEQASLEYRKKMKHKLVKLFNKEWGSEVDGAINIILSKDKPIKSCDLKNPAYYPKGETWAVCRTLNFLIVLYLDQVVGKGRKADILNDLLNLVTQNLAAGFESRMSTPQLLTAVEKLIRQRWVAPKHELLPDEKEAYQTFCRQLAFHKLPPLAAPHSPAKASHVAAPEMAERKKAPGFLAPAQDLSRGVSARTPGGPGLFDLPGMRSALDDADDATMAAECGS